MTVLADTQAFDGLKIIDVVQDHLGRSVIVIDTVSFRALKNAARSGWREIPGVGYGESKRYGADSWIGQMMWMLYGVSRERGASFIVPDSYVPGTPPAGSLPYISDCYDGRFCFAG